MSILSKRNIYIVFVLLACILASISLYRRFFNEPEQEKGTYVKSTRILKEKVWHDMRKTIYCGADFDSKGGISLPAGFETPGHQSRSERMEWEHAVPVEDFGRAFKEWREGDPVCVSKGKAYKGRKCASKASAEFRAMEADMYNLFPSIGSVNATRSNRQYAELPDVEASFGVCKAKVEGKYFEPPDRAKGQVARAALYMDEQYSRYRLSARQRKLFTAWDKKFPPDKEECERGRRIKQLQHTENHFLSRSCSQAGF